MIIEQRLINPTKALRTIRKTTAILTNVLTNQDRDEAMQPSTADAWGVREVVRHLAEYEPILQERVRLILAEEMPVLPSIDNQHITDAPDHEAETQTLVRALLALRQQFLTLLEGIAPEHWSRQGRHPQQGLATLLDVVLNGAMHDIDHIDQLMHTSNGAR